MGRVFQIGKRGWNDLLERLMGDYNVYAPIKTENTLDYQLLTPQLIPQIQYNVARPVSPLKLFFLPVKENVAIEEGSSKPVIIIGCPACDLQALGILDEIYLKEPFVDAFYQKKRENSILVGTDCHSVLEHCHCTSYGIEPVPGKYADLVLSLVGDEVILEVLADKGRQITDRLSGLSDMTGEIQHRLKTLREDVMDQLKKQNDGLPGLETTGSLIKESGDFIWKKYSRTCVSCGACATACPTCTCFLLIDRDGFEKVRQMDACQIPGFARVAAGEDPLARRFVRFRNRYMCKYVWKPARFESVACTGCGRCAEFCIGRIDKNKLFMELKMAKSQIE